MNVDYINVYKYVPLPEVLQDFVFEYMPYKIIMETLLEKQITENDRRNYTISDIWKQYPKWFWEHMFYMMIRGTNFHVLRYNGIDYAVDGMFYKQHIRKLSYNPNRDHTTVEKFKLYARRFRCLKQYHTILCKNETCYVYSDIEGFCYKCYRLLTIWKKYH